jgi:hypothetical protein
MSRLQRSACAGVNGPGCLPPTSSIFLAQTRNGPLGFIRSLAYMTARISLTRIRGISTIRLSHAKGRRYRKLVTTRLNAAKAKSCRDGWPVARMIRR